jgi:two-component system cell cycle response regulator CpdR
LDPRFLSQTILSEKRRFYEGALSVITTILPSEKSLKPHGTYLKPEEMPAFIALKAVPVQKRREPQADARRHLSPEIYPLSGLVCGPILPKPDSTKNTMHKILLAEDDNDMRRFLVKALENAGFQVSSHDNGMSAYQRLREEPFEMLLTDIVMPEMDGIELARRASELDPDIKIMFITGFAAVALNSDSEAPKNAKVLSKPVHLRELVSEVNKMLAA